jgi:hypothetical protein
MEAAQTGVAEKPAEHKMMEDAGPMLQRTK